MTSATTLAPTGGPTRWPVLLTASGVVAWLLPLLHDLDGGPWRDPMHSHGPVIVLVALVLAAMRWGALPLQARHPTPGTSRAGIALMLLAATLAALGRWGDVTLLHGLALAPMLAGIALVCGGRPLLRALAFPVGFLLFAIPWPSALADAVTQPMKHGVSIAAAALLDAMGHTVWLDGVVLGIGPYRLLVADACAGLNSLLMLEAFGLLYLHLVRHPSPARTAVLAAAIVPISLAANVVRVVLLALVTLHFGDAAGQGVVHGASGVILFVAALAMIWPLDHLMRRVAGVSNRPSDAPQALEARPVHSATWPLSAGLLLWSAAAVMLAGPTTPHIQAMPPALAQVLPHEVGAWRALPGIAQVQVTASLEADVYDDLIARTYRHTDGRQVMLTLAYVHAQTRATRVHSPQVCYASSGFRIAPSPRRGLSLGQAPLTARAMLAHRDARHEAVLWWERLGDHQDAAGAVTSAWRFFVQRLRGEMPDGMLVRASSLVSADASADDAATYAAPRAFLTDLMQALPPEHRRLLAR